MKNIKLKNEDSVVFDKEDNKTVIIENGMDEDINIIVEEADERWFVKITKK